MTPRTTTRTDYRPLAVLAACVLTWCGCEFAFAQTAPHDSAASLERRIRNSSVRVQVELGGPRRAFGSGVCVAHNRKAYVVTNYHVIAGVNGALTVCRDGGQWTPCRVLAVDEQMDLAVLSAGQAVGVRVAPAAFNEHHRYQVAGFAGNGKFHTHALTPRQWTGIGLATHSWVEFTGTCCQGDSGGGIFNQRGEVIGVCWGKGKDGGSHVMGTVGIPFRNILAKAAEANQ